MYVPQLDQALLKHKAGNHQANAVFINNHHIYKNGPRAEPCGSPDLNFGRKINYIITNV